VVERQEEKLVRNLLQKKEEGEHAMRETEKKRNIIVSVEDQYQ